MKNAVELTEALCCKLRMFGVPINGPAVAAGTVRVAKEGTKMNISDLFTKVVLPQPRRVALLDKNSRIDRGVLAGSTSNISRGPNKCCRIVLIVVE